MAKRGISSPSTPKAKKSKTQTDQPRIDLFFSSPNRAASGSSLAARNEVKTEGNTSPIGIGSHSKKPRRGVDASEQLDSKKASANLDREVIDVDLEQDLQILSSVNDTASSLTISPEKKNGNTSPLKMMHFIHADTKPPVYDSLSPDPLTFSLQESPWPSNSAAPFSFLSFTLASLSETRSRIAITNILTNALRTIVQNHPKSLLPAVYMLQNSLSPPYSPLELGLGPSIISKAVQQVSGLTSQALKRLYNNTGDLGDVAFEAKSRLRTLVPHPPLRILDVYESLLKISRLKGQGAVNRKQAIVEQLLVAAKGEETRFLVRTLSQNLRTGAVRYVLFRIELFTLISCVHNDTTKD